MMKGMTVMLLVASELAACGSSATAFHVHMELGGSIGIRAQHRPQGQGRDRPTILVEPMCRRQERAASSGFLGVHGQLLDIFSGGKPEPNPQGEKEQREFKLNRGKALDTLLQDYPILFSHQPDFSIYRDDISLTDSAGFSASGITSYKMFFSAIRMIVPMIYHRALVSVHVMNKYDNDDGIIRLRWKAELYRGAGETLEDAERRRKNEGLRRMGFKVPSEDHVPPSDKKGDKLVEGISVYRLDAKGRIYSHQIETLSPTTMQEAYAKLQVAVPGIVSGGGANDMFVDEKPAPLIEGLDAAVREVHEEAAARTEDMVPSV